MGRVIGMILLGAGAFLVALAGLVRFQVADRLIAAPVDQYSITKLSAQDARYFSKQDLKVMNGDLDITVTTRGDVAGSKADDVVWDQFTSVTDVTNDRPRFDMSEFRSAFNKYTGTAVNCCGASIDKEPVSLAGQIYLFPFGAEKKTYQVFNSSAGKAFDASFDGEDTIDGLAVYRYVQQVPPTKTQTLTAPASAMGMDETGDVQVERWYDGTSTYWVEPVSGIPVKQEHRRHEVLKTADGVERKPALIATAVYTPETVADLVKQADDTRRQIGLVQTVIPVVLLVVGLLAMIVGIVLIFRNPPRGRRGSATAS
ncbi:hypothetical protein Sru01_03060 [Sphaerisporangium rufum]|uniref:DUF3068 domain-containing protein n=1 Tax=Sphaerisporangium rufum TaxID=1381558 RepID=A0A919QWC3_9ACTN|nr:DUF3068 domain-containing protein [Sphaerisporangium rufum]GII75324.1 hypothetical protein Sru01_03060 [Sphaerisporangium rufum]